MLDKIDFLYRTLQLASFGLGKCSPNPLVGWVLVSSQAKIIADGWFPITSLSTLALDLKTETNKSLSLYVNALYEPEAGFVQSLSSLGIANIYCAGRMSDTVKQVIPSNISWTDQLLYQEETFLNRRHLTLSSLHRPYIILKWAETRDGFVARENYDSKWISNTHSRKLVHKWRTEEDAIMVGTNTAHYDNPKLNARMWIGRDPVRVVIDKQLRLDKNLNLFDGSQPTLCYNLSIDETQDNLHLISIPQSNNLDFFSRLLTDLGQRNIQSLIIEGGANLLHFLIQHQLWDEARIFTAPKSFGNGIAAPKLEKSFLAESSFVMDDALKIYRKPKS